MRILAVFLLLNAIGLAATPEEIGKLVANLGAPSYATREAAQKELLALGEAGVPALKAAENSPDPEVRMRVQEILGKVSGGELEKPNPEILANVEALMATVQNSNHANLQAVVDMGKIAVPALASLANRENYGHRVYAMIALTRIADPQSFPVLAKLFQSSISGHMTGYVGQIKNPRMIKALIEVWQKVGDDATDKLRQQVRKMSGQDLGDDPAAYLKWYTGRYESSAD